ncbi:HipA N-terminal domain-containing protein [Flavobacterium pectinovorum]|uniref:HipA N-terminal domain-containing protein n=1 Tax=Flavobacterium pectinovorum TaxID=29533 RepID=UPI001FAC7866|nr:HipA N-terminal domain-containing protein [Flavobacterium pectinovorum]MCI9846062.1 HipA N-terminal domain-containing protein [Flavobacterium pectinovorum]
MIKAEIKMHNKTAGWLSQDENGYHFFYDKVYLESNSPEAISLTLPIRKDTYTSKILFPFFDGLIPEGWLLDIAEKNWKLNPRDRMGLLLSCCKDCIGAVSVYPVNEEEI